MKYGATLKTVEFLELQVIARATKEASLSAWQGEGALGGIDEIRRLSEFRIMLREYLNKIVADTATEKEDGIEDKTWAFKFTTYVFASRNESAHHRRQRKKIEVRAVARIDEGRC